MPEPDQPDQPEGPDDLDGSAPAGGTNVEIPDHLLDGFDTEIPWPEVADVRGDPPPEGPLARAAMALRIGLPVVVPTETVYGLAVDPFLPGATDRLFQLKERPKTVPVAVMVANAHQAEPLVHVITRPVRRLMMHFWPGPLTIVLPRRHGLDVDLGIAADTIGLRCPDHPVARALAEMVGPLATTSANAHGDPTPHEAADVAGAFGSAVPIVLDAGRCDQRPSTVVEITADGHMEVHREGPVRINDVLDVMDRSW